MHRHVNRIFYVTVLLISIIGASQGAAGWLNWWIPLAFVAVGAVELGGVVLSMHADRRRQLGERAIPARTLGAAVAAGAVSVNWFGHPNVGPAAFFAGSSVLGYTFWLIDSSARRRDALRKARKLEATAPIYGVMSWARHPSLTYRARQLAIAAPKLGKVGSLEAARAQVRAERRTAAIASALRKRIADHVDPTMAVIAVNTYDIDEIAQRLADGADYDVLTSLLADELLPARLHSGAPAIMAQPAIKQAEQPLMLAAPQHRKPRSVWDAHEVARMILNGESDDLIMKSQPDVSTASLGRIRRVVKILQADRSAEIRKSEKVRPDVVQFIRSEVSK